MVASYPKSHPQHHVRTTRQWGSSLTWQMSHWSPCLLDHDLQFDDCTVTEEVIWKMLARTCKCAFFVPVSCDSLHVHLLILFCQS